MSYNLTALGGSGSLGNLFNLANTFSGGMLFSLLVLAFFLITFMALKKWEFADALLASSFTSFIVSIIAVTVGWLNLFWALGFLALMAFTGFYLYVTK